MYCGTITKDRNVCRGCWIKIKLIREIRKRIKDTIERIESESDQNDR